MNEVQDLSRYEVLESECDMIIGTMRGWLSGEPVWPLSKILSSWGQEFEMYRTVWARGGFERADRFRSIRLMALRDRWIAEFGFAIPCQELIEEIAWFAPIVEIGAGSGYLTTLARVNGVDIVGTDPSDPVGYVFEVGGHDTNQLKIAGKTAVRRFRDRAVLCSWPSLNETWFRQALRAMRIGQRLIVIREECCAEDSAWDYLDACFVRDGLINIPAWPHMNDYAAVYRKRRQTPSSR